MRFWVKKNVGFVTFVLLIKRVKKHLEYPLRCISNCHMDFVSTLENKNKIKKINPGADMEHFMASLPVFWSCGQLLVCALENTKHIDGAI